MSWKTVLVAGVVAALVGSVARAENRGGGSCDLESLALATGLVEIRGLDGGTGQWDGASYVGNFEGRVELVGGLFMPDECGDHWWMRVRLERRTDTGWTSVFDERPHLSRSYRPDERRLGLFWIPSVDTPASGDYRITASVGSAAGELPLRVPQREGVLYGTAGEELAPRLGFHFEGTGDDLGTEGRLSLLDEPLVVMESPLEGSCLSPDGGEVRLRVLPAAARVLMQAGDGPLLECTFDGEHWRGLLPASAGWHEISAEARFYGGARQSVSTTVQVGDCEPDLIFAAAGSGAIERLDSDTLHAERLVEGVGSPHGLALDIGTNSLYFTTWWPGIYSVELDAERAPRLLYRTYRGGQGIAVDPGEGLLFWGTYYGGLYRGSTDGAEEAVEIVPRSALGGTGVAMGVAVDAAARHVYFVSRSHQASVGADVWRCRYDGSELTRLYHHSGSETLFLDRAAGELFFTDLDVDTGGSVMVRYDLATDEASEVFPLPTAGICQGFVRHREDGSFTLSMSAGPGRGALWRTAADGSGAERLREGLPDGRGLILTAPGGAVCTPDMLALAAVRAGLRPIMGGAGQLDGVSYVFANPFLKALVLDLPVACAGKWWVHARLESDDGSPSGGHVREYPLAMHDHTADDGSMVWGQFFARTELEPNTPYRFTLSLGTRAGGVSLKAAPPWGRLVQWWLDYDIAPAASEDDRAGLFWFLSEPVIDIEGPADDSCLPEGQSQIRVAVVPEPTWVRVRTNQGEWQDCIRDGDRWVLPWSPTSGEYTIEATAHIPMRPVPMAWDVEPAEVSVRVGACGPTLLLAHAGDGTVRRFDAGSGTSDTIIRGAPSPHGLALAPETDTLFVSMWSGGLRAAVLGDPSESPFVLEWLTDVWYGAQGLAVDPDEGLAFWGTYYRGLFRGATDGVGAPLEIVSRGELGNRGVTMGLTVDTDSQVLYFVSRSYRAESGGDVWRCNYDGSNLEWLYHHHGSDALFLDTEEQVLYFPDYDLESDTSFMVRYELASGESTYLFPLPAPGACSGFVRDSADGSFYLSLCDGVGGSDLWHVTEDGQDAERLLVGMPDTRAVIIER